jgi:hypothetical protein
LKLAELCEQFLLSSRVYNQRNHRCLRDKHSLLRSDAIMDLCFEIGQTALEPLGALAHSCAHQNRMTDQKYFRANAASRSVGVPNNMPNSVGICRDDWRESRSRPISIFYRVAKSDISRLSHARNSPQQC